MRSLPFYKESLPVQGNQAQPELLEKILAAGLLLLALLLLPPLMLLLLLLVEVLPLRSEERRVGKECL